MNLLTHFIVSLILSLVLYPIYGINSFFVLIGGFLIDIDHYIWAVFKFKDLDFRNTKMHCRKHNLLYKFQVFHLMEFVFLCVVLSFFHIAFMFISMGLVLHLIMDFYYIQKNIGRQDVRLISIFQLLFIKK